MLKKLFSSLREYKKSALISPIFIGIEVIFEMLIPTLMAMIIDNGLNGNNGKGDIRYGPYNAGSSNVVAVIGNTSQ